MCYGTLSKNDGNDVPRKGFQIKDFSVFFFLFFLQQFNWLHYCNDNQGTLHLTRYNCRECDSYFHLVKLTHLINYKISGSFQYTISCTSHNRRWERNAKVLFAHKKNAKNVDLSATFRMHSIMLLRIRYISCKWSMRACDWVSR